MSQEVDDECLRLDPVRVGCVPLGIGTPDQYVTVADGDTPILRVDVYACKPDAFAFQDAIIWNNSLVIGFGSHVHAVFLVDRSAVTTALGSYFGCLHPTSDYILIVSGERIFRMDPDRAVVWRSEPLGVDGVVVHDLGPPVIRGDGDWDPPGGWQPFAISATDGKPKR